MGCNPSMGRPPRFVSTFRAWSPIALSRHSVHLPRSPCRGVTSQRVCADNAAARRHGAVPALTRLALGQKCHGTGSPLGPIPYLASPIWRFRDKAGQGVNGISDDCCGGDLALVPFPVGSSHRTDDGLRVSDLLARLGGAKRLVMKLWDKDVGIPVVASGVLPGADGVLGQALGRSSCICSGPGSSQCDRPTGDATYGPPVRGASRYASQRLSLGSSAGAKMAPRPAGPTA